MIESEYLSTTYCLVISWTQRCRCVSYIVGGIILTAIADCFSYSVSILLRFAELLTWIKLVLLSFRVSSTVELRHLDLNHVAASELVTYAILWILSLGSEEVRCSNATSAYTLWICTDHS